MIKFKCNHCDQPLEAEDEHAGIVLECPSCKNKIAIPDRKAKAKPPPLKRVPPPLPTAQGKGDMEHVNIPDEPLNPLKKIWPLAMLVLFYGWILAEIPVSRILDPSDVFPIIILLLGSIPVVVLSFMYLLNYCPDKNTWKIFILSLAFTAVAGVILLLVFQYITAYMASHPVSGNTGRILLRNKTSGIIYAILMFLGWANQAVDSDGIIQRLIGSVFGTGICEETTKILPLLILILMGKHVQIGYRGFLTVGFFSGLGFGIAENFFSYAPWTGESLITGNIIRWFACAPSHGIYATIDAAFLWYVSNRILSVSNGWMKFLYIVGAVMAVSILHGVYNVLCGFGNSFGIAIDAASMVLLCFCISYFYAKGPGPFGDAKAFPSKFYKPGIARMVLIMLIPIPAIVAAGTFARIPAIYNQLPVGIWTYKENEGGISIVYALSPPLFEKDKGIFHVEIIEDGSKSSYGGQCVVKADTIGHLIHNSNDRSFPVGAPFLFKVIGYNDNTLKIKKEDGGIILFSFATTASLSNMVTGNGYSQEAEEAEQEVTTQVSLFNTWMGYLENECGFTVVYQNTGTFCATLLEDEYSASFSGRFNVRQNTIAHIVDRTENSQVAAVGFKYTYDVLSLTQSTLQVRRTDGKIMTFSAYENNNSQERDYTSPQTEKKGKLYGWKEGAEDWKKQEDERKKRGW